MTDRELMVLAAKAAGLPASSATWSDFDWDVYGWSPLTDDGDALRLAVKLKIDIRFPQDNDMYVDAGNCDGYTVYLIDEAGDRAAATRHAIVRAAASIGEKQ